MGLAAALFFILHHMLVKSSLFLLGGMMARSGAGFDLRRSGGLLAARPLLALLFAVSAASLVGIPPLSGFWAKLLVVRESFALGQFAWGAAALAVGGLTLYSMVKIWIEAFWKPAPETTNEAAPGPPRALPAGAWLASATLAGLTLAVGLAPQPLIDYLQLAAGAMLAPGAELPR
jgi:multicomponent Na+:H+ antiporter subunit D